MFRSNTFSGGTDGVTLTAGNTGGVSGDPFDTFAGTPQFESDNATGARGPMTVKFADSAARIRWDGFSLAGRDIWVREYFYLTANPSSSDIVTFIAQTTGTNNMTIFVDNNGKIAVNDTTGAQVGLSSTSVNLNAWFRLEVFCHTGTTTSNGEFEVRLYNSPDSFTITETVSGTGNNFSTTVPNRVSWPGGTGIGVYQGDDFAITDTGWIGPSPYGSPTNPRVSFSAVQRAGSW